MAESAKVESAEATVRGEDGGACNVGVESAMLEDRYE